MSSQKSQDKLIKKLAFAGLMAALCYAGYAFIPPLPIPGLFDLTSGTKVHFGNAFVVLGALFLGGPYGGLAGAVGLSLADILTGYGASAPRTFICKLLIGLIVGLLYALSLKSQLTSVYKNETAADYVRPASFKVADKKDIFMYSKTEKTEKPKQQQ